MYRSSLRVLRPLILAAFLSARALALEAGTCTGDCNGDRSVDVSELVSMVAIAQDELTVGSCLRGDRNLDAQISVDEIVSAVANASDECAPLAICGLPADITSCLQDSDCRIGSTWPCCGCQGHRIAANQASQLTDEQKRFCCLGHCPHRPCSVLPEDVSVHCVDGQCALIGVTIP